MTIKTDCNGGCDNETKHLVLFSKRILEPHYDDEKKLFENVYMIVQCNGCGQVSFLLQEQNIFFGQHKDEPKYILTTYPNEYDDPLFLTDEEQHSIPKSIMELYDEITEAFKNSSSVLAGIGLRTLVEAICMQLKIPGKNLHDKIKALHVKGLISDSELIFIDKLRIIGNVSAHEIKRISIEKLEYALQIVNHVLRSIYVLPKINKLIRI
jgi:hypothetical protein